jgi:hypothetical protein
VSHRNQASGLGHPAVDVLSIDWMATSFGQVFDDASLPLVPPDLAALGGGQFRIRGECSVCGGPASFFQIEGTLTELVLGPPVGDANGDGVVSGADFTIWADHFGSGPGATEAPGDFSGDGFVTGADYVIWADNFGISTTAVPEPATLTMLGGALLLVALWTCRGRMGVVR